MKVYLVNDTSSYHAGSWAVIRSLEQKLAREGHSVIHATPRPLPPELPWIEAADALVVNGEGAMQEEAKGWDDGRVTRIMKGLRYAKQLGKRAYLVNSVWHNNHPVWGDVLESLDGLWVREIASQREMEREQGVKPDVFLDLSYSCELDDAAGARDLAGRDVLGTIYTRNLMPDERSGPFDRRFRGMEQLSLGGAAEHEGLSIGIAGLARRGARRLGRTPALRALGRIVAGPPAGWSHVVRSLRGAAVYATGQHHGVYAACRARVPFAFTKLYNHKITGLLEWAGAEIPMAHTLDEVVACMRWAKANGDVFERLFHWMERQPTWPGLSATRRRSPAQS